MAQSFLQAARQTSPKPSYKLTESSLGNNYLRIDDVFKGCTELRLEAIKAFFRSYQNNKHKLSYTIEEVETLIGWAKASNCSTDDYFDAIYHHAESDAGFAKFLFSTFSYLRNELRN